VGCIVHEPSAEFHANEESGSLHPVKILVSVWSGIRKLELWMLAGIALIGGALWAFAELADEIEDGESHAFDKAILLALRNPSNPEDPLGPRWLELIARDVTSLGGTAVLTLMTIATLGFLLMTRKRGAAILVAVSVAGGTLLSSLLKSGFDRPRPDLVPHAVEVSSASFPSGHAMLATVTYLTLGALLVQVHEQRRVQVYLLGWALLLSLLVGASRIYLGVHWPTDVLAGWCVGAAWALLCAAVALYLQRRGSLDRADPS
jgi:undecaprenyl-diphosphatase